MAFDWKSEWAKRPWWMQLCFVFCLYMTFVYLPYDLFWKPVAGDQEVWLGFVLHGWAAKVTEPLHWAIYAAGAYGFWRMKGWMWPWAGVYVAQIAVGMLVWSLLDGPGVVVGLAAMAVFATPTVALLRGRRHFQPAEAERAEA